MSNADIKKLIIEFDLQNIIDSRTPQTVWQTIKNRPEILKKYPVKRKDIFEYIKNNKTNASRSASVQRELTKVVKPVYDQTWSRKPYDNFQADLFFLDRKYWVRNKNTKILLTCIDVHSRFVWVVGLTAKTAAKIVDAFTYLFDDMNAFPKQLITDEGSEFTSKKIQDLFEQRNVEHFVQAIPSDFQKEKNHVPIIERFHRDLRAMILRLTQTDLNFIDRLQKEIDVRNNSYHSGVKGIPADILKGKSAPKQEQTELPKLPIGTKVRLMNFKTGFEKSTQRWSTSVYTISGYDGVKYELEGDNDRVYFRRELLPIDVQVHLDAQPSPPSTYAQPAKPRTSHRQRAIDESLLKNDLKKQFIVPANRKRQPKKTQKLDL